MEEPKSSELKTIEIEDLILNLEKSIEDRIESHENARTLMQDLQSAGEKLRERSKKTF